MLQKANPGLDIAGVPHVPVDRELGTKEGCAQLRNKLLRRIGPVAEPEAQVAVEARLMPCPMAFMPISELRP
jgi:hypothetical protein